MSAVQDQWAAGDFDARWPGIGGESGELTCSYIPPVKHECRCQTVLCLTDGFLAVS